MKRFVGAIVVLAAAVGAGAMLRPVEFRQAGGLAGKAALRIKEGVIANPVPVVLGGGTFLLTVAYHTVRGRSLRESVEVAAIGVRTAEVIVAHLGDATRFHHANEVDAYAGLVPRQYQSGATDRRGRITKRGPKLLRAALVECVWCCRRSNAWALAVWQRLRANGVSRKKAIVALARKLLVRCWGMLKRGEPWQAPAGAAATASPGRSRRGGPHRGRKG